jgi:hypothetical protein
MPQEDRRLNLELVEQEVDDVRRHFVVRHAARVLAVAVVASVEGDHPAAGLAM